MDSNSYAQLSVSLDSLEPFVICLALGTLRAMREHTIPYEAGIWTLGRPGFSHRQELEGLLSEETLRVIQTADEVNALAKLGGESEAERLLDEMIETLQSRLKSLSDGGWYAKWGKIGIEET